MTGLADLTYKARVFNWNTGMTEGQTWRAGWLNVNDAAGNPIDLTSATLVASVVEADGTVLLSTAAGTLTATGGNGTVTISATAAQTSGLAGTATYSSPRVCYWSCRATISSDTVTFWGPAESHLRIYPE